MGDTQPKRSVLPFAAEIRLKIYRNLVKNTYLAVGTTFEDWFMCSKEDRKLLPACTGLVILQVSKATCAEALPLLYEESIFLFQLDFMESLPGNTPAQRYVHVGATPSVWE